MLQKGCAESDFRGCLDAAKSFEPDNTLVTDGQLVPLNSPTLPRLDSTLLPGWAGKFILAASKATETPPELAAGMVLAACATACARRLRILVKPGYFEPLNLWVVVAMPPASRKSQIQKAANAPLLDWSASRALELEPEIQRITSERKTMEVRANQLRLKAAKAKTEVEAEQIARQAARIEMELPAVPTTPRLWTSDVTPEQLGNLLADHEECMAWLSSEGGIFDTLGGRYSHGVSNLDLVLKAHSGDPDQLDRGSRPSVFLRCPRLTVGLSPQPEVLHGLAAKKGFRGRGLLARFLYLLPQSPLGFRTLETAPIPQSVKEDYASGLRAMLDWDLHTGTDGQTCCHLLKLSPDAMFEWHQFALFIESEMRPGERLEHVTDWAGKAPGAAARIAGILHAIEHAHGAPWEHLITAETMNAALEIMAVITHHSLAALDFMGTDYVIDHARHVWRWVERSRLPLFTVREAFNNLRSRFQRVSEIHAALDVLEERGYVELLPPGKREGPGRPPSPTVQVRPEIVESWR
jgi:hypothetical protein